MVLICPALLKFVRWGLGSAWLMLRLFALVIAMSLDVSLALAKDVQVADDAAAAGASIDGSADQLVAREMAIGRYHLAKKNYTSAINRFKTVVIHYQATPQVDEALAHLTESYLTLGIVNEAQTAVAVLGRNFPDSPWYNNALDMLTKAGLEPHEDKHSWIIRIFK